MWCGDRNQTAALLSNEIWEYRESISKRIPKRTPKTKTTALVPKAAHQRCLRLSHEDLACVARTAAVVAPIDPCIGPVLLSLTNSACAVGMNTQRNLVGDLRHEATPGRSVVDLIIPVLLLVFVDDERRQALTPCVVTLAATA